MTGTAIDATLLAALRHIAEGAGAAIMDVYEGRVAADVRRKIDHSPVTAADDAAEAHILSALRELTPDIPVISEEAAEAGTLPTISGRRFWLVDPMDGTKEFLERNGEFTVNIALIEDGQPAAGVVHAPALGKTWAGAGTGTAAYFEGGKAPLPIRARQIPAAGAVVAVSRRHGDAAAMDAFLKNLKVDSHLAAGSSLKFCLVASGQADVYPRFGRTMEWDTAAGHAVLLAAGGRVDRADGGADGGTTLTYGKPGFENPPFIARGLPA
jgi:3'(2'), 5'-bisphosphate nucleotidase